MMQDPEIKRWTPKPKFELIKLICWRQTTVPEAAREYDLTQEEVESWMGDAEGGMEKALRANPEDFPEQCEKQFSELKEAYGEAMLENKFLKIPTNRGRLSYSAISHRPRSRRAVYCRDGRGRSPDRSQ